MAERPSSKVSVTSKQPKAKISTRGRPSNRSAKVMHSRTVETKPRLTASLQEKRSGYREKNPSQITRNRSGFSLQQEHRYDQSYDLVPINIVSYGGKNYDLSKKPPIDSQLVKEQTKIVKEHLRLTTLGRDLSSLGKFVRLACCGVVGHTELQIKTREVLINVGDITDDTYHALNDFERTSKNALQTMQTAYGFLKENLEGEALNMFNQIQKNSEKMYDISNALSEKCKSQSVQVHELGDETLKEKTITEAQKDETDKLITKTKIEKVVEEESIKHSTEETDKKEVEVAATKDDEKKVFERKRELAKQVEEKLQLERQNTKQRKQELKSEYEVANNSITDEIRKHQQKFEAALISNKNSFEKQLQELDEALKERIKAAEKTYENDISNNQKRFKEAKKENDEQYKKTIETCEKSHEETISQAEKAYKSTIQQIDKEYDDAMKTSEAECDKTLKLAKDTLDAELEANERSFGAKVDAYHRRKKKAQFRGEWSTKDAEAKHTKYESESNARSEYISAQKKAKERQNSKSSIALSDKEDKIAKSEEKKHKMIERAAQNLKESNHEAIERKTNEDNVAKLKKEEGIYSAHEQKDKGELKAKEYKGIADKSAEEIKRKDDDVCKSEKEDILHKYQLDLQQIDSDLEQVETQINEEYQKQLKIIDENFQYLKEKTAQYECDIKSLQKQREESFQKMLQFAQQIKDGLDLSKGQETSILCLHEAKSALNNIQVIMRNASNFWKKIGKHCEDISQSVLSTQIQSIKATDSLTRQRMWKSNTFKEAALEYQGQWYALKDMCAAAGEHITSVQDEINQYICENPSKEEAVTLVQQLATDLLGSDMLKNMIADKPAND